MKTANVLRVVAAFLIITAALFSMTNRLIRADDKISESAVSKKLDEILQNQKIMIGEISAIKEELRVLKIRITQNQ